MDSEDFWIMCILLLAISVLGVAMTRCAEYIYKKQTTIEKVDIVLKAGQESEVVTLRLGKNAVARSTTTFKQIDSLWVSGWVSDDDGRIEITIIGRPNGRRNNADANNKIR